MEKVVAQFPAQLTDALNIQYDFNFFEEDFQPRNIVISGLGGSAIGGGIVKDYAYPLVNIPIYVNRNYFLPGYVNEHSLVIICSYSGNTEETVSALEDALMKNAKIVCITSGGAIAKIATEKKLNLLKLPTGYQPREAIGVSICNVLHVLAAVEVIGRSYLTEVKEAVELIEKEQDYIKEHSAQLAQDLFGKIPVLYSSNSMQDIVIRWRQQINENSKTLAWENVLPEMNHNEIVGWSEPHENLAVVFIRSDNDFGRIQTRMELSIDLIKQSTPHVYEVYSKGNNFFERALYLIHYGDWLSLHLARLKGANPNEVAPIDYIKSNLG